MFGPCYLTCMLQNPGDHQNTGNLAFCLRTASMPRRLTNKPEYVCVPSTWEFYNKTSEFLSFEWWEKKKEKEKDNNNKTMVSTFCLPRPRAAYALHSDQNLLFGYLLCSICNSLIDSICKIYPMSLIFEISCSVSWIGYTWDRKLLFWSERSACAALGCRQKRRWPL